MTKLKSYMKNLQEAKYIRIHGKNGVYILTQSEWLKALDRENYGVVGEVEDE